MTEKQEGVARRRGGLRPELGKTKSTTRTRYDKNAGTCLRERDGTERLGRSHPTITAVQQQHNSSGAARTDQSTTTAYSSSNTAVQRYTCGPVVRQELRFSTTELGGICTFFTILYLSGKSASRPRERLFMPPARVVGTRRRLRRRGHRGLVCGAGEARACGRQGPGGER